VRLWRTSDGSLLRSFTVTMHTYALAFSGDGTQLLIGRGGNVQLVGVGDNYVTTVNVLDGVVLSVQNLFAPAIKISPDNQIVYLGANGSVARTVSLIGRRCRLSLDMQKRSAR
jgi:hypothetical protein